MSSSSLQEILACIGQPVAGNPTQFLMERAFVHRGLDWRYLTLEVTPESLGDAVRGARAMGFRGFNLAAPHKTAVLEFLDEVSDTAREIEAVNCVSLEKGRLVGENTEGRGLVEGLREIIDPTGKRVVILGSGGAARAAAVALAHAGVAEITIVARQADRGTALANLMESKTSARCVEWTGDYDVPAETDVIVHATTVGQTDAKARVGLSVATLQPHMVVADVVFSPPATRLIRDARDRKCQTLDGLAVMVYRALVDFKIWTAVDGDAEIMRDAVEEYLGF